MVEAKAKRSNDDYEHEKVQKKRLEKIIDICKLNKDANEEWIRQLTFLITNLSKMSLRMEERKKVLSKETSELTRIGQVLAQQQQRKDDEVQRLAYEVDCNMESQFRLDQAIMINYSEEAEEKKRKDLNDSFKEGKTSQKPLQLDMPKLPSNKLEKAAEKGHQVLMEELKADLTNLAKFLGISQAELLKSQGIMTSNSKYESKQMSCRIFRGGRSTSSFRYFETESGRT